MQQDSCPAGSYAAAPLSPDDPGFDAAMAKKGCQTDEKNVGCIKYFGTPDSITVCCLPTAGGKPDCSAYGSDAKCKASCNAATEDEKNGNCPNTGEKCCKPKASITPPPGAASQECSFGEKPQKGLCVPKDKDYTDAKCMNLRAIDKNPLNAFSEVTCADGTSMCCLVDPGWKPSAAAAAAPTAAKPPSEYKLTNPLGVTDIAVILGRIIKTFLGIVGGIALMVFVYGGVMWMTARGDAGQVKKGQEALTTAVIGLFIVTFAYTLAGNFVTFLTSQQSEIAQEENRGGAAPQTAAEAQQVQTIQSAQAQAEQQQAGQAAAAAAGQEAGVTPQPIDCGQLTGQAYLDCISSSGQSLYNTPGLQTGLPGGQKDCKGDPNCSQVGWITVCYEKVFDTGYGTYKNLGCRSPDACAAGSILSSNCQGLKDAFSAGPLKDFVANNCSKIALGSFGNKCPGGVCCKPKQ